MNVIAIIPGRMQATRFPGKPMAKIHGIPMIGHVYERTRLAKSVTETWAATCDKEIYDYIRSIGGKAVMTHDRHERCSDRTAEALLKIEKETGRKADIVAMVQGDEPMVFPDMIDEAVEALASDAQAGVACLMAPIESLEEFDDPNSIKVVTSLQGRALYFSREPIPSRRKGSKTRPMFKQVCIIPFKRDYLLKFNSMPPTALEIVESVDLNRVLEHGEAVKMALTQRKTHSVDTPEDLKLVEKAMKNDELLKGYAAQAAPAR